MGLGNCPICNLPIFPFREPGCICVARSRLREVVCVGIGHDWMPRYWRGYLTGEQVTVRQCRRCGRAANPGERFLRFRARLRALFIAWEIDWNHPQGKTSARYPAGWAPRFAWLCGFAEWITKGECHD